MARQGFPNQGRLSDHGSNRRGQVLEVEASGSNISPGHLLDFNAIDHLY